ncbi:MAG: ABC-F family ATP-binding cassette domain-containing protein [Filifactoraceae bacterium]
MITISINNIYKSFGVKEILRGISFSLNESEKVGLVGHNGAGKTTLFKIIAGELEKDSGDIFIGKDLQIAYLKQNVNIESSNSLLDEVLTVFEDTIKLEKELRDLEHQISAVASNNPDNLEKLMTIYSSKQEIFNKNNGYSYNSEATGILRGLGFKDEEFKKPISTLSGGEQTRLLLSKILLKKPDVLLLDEPTNHLDTGAVQWLENFIKQYRGNVILISHDRYFLDKTVDSIFHMEHGNLKQYIGNYSEYLLKREVDREIEEKAYKDNQEEIKRQKEIIAQLKAFGREKQVKRARSREKLLDKMEVVDKPISQHKKAHISFAPKVISGYDVMNVQSLSKAYGNRILFNNIDINIQRGEKVALIGPNGIGKTTLFNILLGQDNDYIGGINFGINVFPEYFDQTRSDLNPNKTILDEIWDEYPNLNESLVRSMLAGFLFLGDEVYKKISSLSGGEQSRVSLLKLMLSKSNFLFLDEPTNHLDIDSKEVLEDALISYEGTIFVISHDRYFLNKVIDRILVLSPSGIENYLGNYDYYIDKLRDLEEAKKLSNVPETINKTQQIKDRKKEKEIEREEKKLKKLIQDIESKIHQLENDITKLEEQFCLEEVYSNPEKSITLQNNKTEKEKELNEAMLLWEELLS